MAAMPLGRCMDKLCMRLFDKRFWGLCMAMLQQQSGIAVTTNK